jgi:hypothetical protein
MAQSQGLFGRLINTVGERMALVGARHVSPSFGLGIELRPLVQITGEELVRAAADCLTQDIKGLAKKWQGSTADEQVDICRMLYYRLRSTSQNPKGELTMDVLVESIESNMRSNERHVDKVLPRRYGMWNPDSCVANCQGKTQMLVAFAHLAGARVVTVHPLKHAGKVLNSLRGRIYEKIVGDMKKRNITHIDATFEESIRTGRLDLLRRASDEYFHVCVCIQVADGRWVLIDPHGLNFGIMGDGWGMSEITNKLDRYHEVLPGLNILATDKGRHERMSKDMEVKTDELIARSVKLEKHLSTATDPFDLIEALIGSGELRYLVESFSEHSQETLDTAFSDPDYVNAVASMLAFGGPIDILGGIQESFLKRRVHTIITAYHCLAMNGCNNELTDNGTLVHPECEFSHPEYSVAISAINSLVSRYCSEVNRFFMDYSFDQTSMYNALRGLMSPWCNKEDVAIAEAAAKTLVTLPVQHPLCRRRSHNIHW